jgi:hypothetical protein
MILRGEKINLRELHIAHHAAHIHSLRFDLLAANFSSLNAISRSRYIFSLSTLQGC